MKITQCELECSYEKISSLVIMFSVNRLASLPKIFTKEIGVRQDLSNCASMVNWIIVLDALAG